MSKVLSELLDVWRNALDANSWGNLALSPSDHARIKRQVAALERAIAIIEREGDVRIVAKRLVDLSHDTYVGSDALDAAGRLIALLSPKEV